MMFGRVLNLSCGRNFVENAKHTGNLEPNSMTGETRWLDRMVDENRRFRARIRADALPVKRTPGSVGVITCMDPRVNLEAIGIPQFGANGESASPVRIVRS